MRLVSYNILDGGQGRADPLAEILLAQKPDIVGLVEADQPDVVARVAKRLGVQAFTARGKSHAVAILTKWTLVETINHALLRPELTNCLLEALVRSPAGDQWRLGLLHLHPHGKPEDEAIREREIGAVLDVFASHRAAGRPHLIAGDFNSNSPVQQIDPANCMPRTREEWEENGGMLPRTAIQKLLDAGYVETLAAARGAAATTEGTFTTQFPGQRVDFVFAHGFAESAVTSAWVEHDRLARYASDHFPIGVEIRG